MRFNSNQMSHLVFGYTPWGGFELQPRFLCSHSPQPAQLDEETTYTWRTGNQGYSGNMNTYTKLCYPHVLSSYTRRLGTTLDGDCDHGDGVDDDDDDDDDDADDT